MKIELRLKKATEGRWGALVRDPEQQGTLFDVDILRWASDVHLIRLCVDPTLSKFPTAEGPVPVRQKQHKNWEKVSDNILQSEKDKTTTDDPNAGGDAALNGFFQTLYKDADPDSQRAMMKSFVESGGTTLSTNWDEVKKEEVTVKPPEGSEWKKWGV